MPSVWRGVPSQSLALGEPWHLFHRAGRPRSPNATWKQATAGECFLYANSSPIPKSPVLQAACIQKYRQMICAWHVPRHFFLCPSDRQCSPIPKCPLSTSMCKHCRSRGHTRAALHATNDHLHVSLNPDSLPIEGDPGHLEIGEHCRSHGHTGAYMQQKTLGASMCL